MSLESLSPIGWAYAGIEVGSRILGMTSSVCGGPLQGIAKCGAFHGLEKAAERECNFPGLNSELARKAFLMGRSIGAIESIEELVQYIGPSSSLGLIKEALGAARLAAYVWGIAEIGSSIVNKRLQNGLNKEYSDLAEKVSNTSKQLFKAIGAYQIIRSLDIVNHTTAFQMSGYLLLATTVSQVAKYGLEYHLKSQWVLTDLNILKLKDRNLAEVVSDSSGRIMLEAAALLAIPLFASEFNWPAVSAASIFTQHLVYKGSFLSIGYLPNLIGWPSVYAVAAKEALRYSSYLTMATSFNYFVNPLLCSDEGTICETATKVMSFSKSSILFLGSISLGSLLLPKLLAMKIGKKYSALSKRAVSAAKYLILGSAVLRMRGFQDSQIEALARNTFMTVTVSFLAKYALEYYLKEKWVGTKKDTWQWQEGYYDAKRAESVTVSAHRVFLCLAAQYTLMPNDSYSSWVTGIGCGIYILKQAVDQFFLGHPQTLKTWKHANRIVQLHEKGGLLYFHIYDRNTNKQLADFNSNVTNQASSREFYMKQRICFAGSNYFIPLIPIHTWEGNERVHLLKIENQIMVSVEHPDGEFGFSRLLLDDVSAYFSRETYLKVSNLNARIKSGDVEACKELYWYMEPKSVRAKRSFLTEEDPVRIDHEVDFKVRSESSRIDSRFLVSEQCWGVTMIRYGKHGHHASLVIEGISSGKYSMYHADLNGPNNVDFEVVEKKSNSQKRRFNFSPSELKWDGRTCVFKISRENAESLIQAIKKEKSGEEPVAYHKAGSESLIHLSASEDRMIHNCFTWARWKLLGIGINIGWLATDYLAAIPHLYMPPKTAFKSRPFPDLGWALQKKYDMREV